MRLSEFDQKYVRITLVDGKICDGWCTWNSAAYMEAEIGGTEEALQIDHWVFRTGDIARVEEADPSEQGLWMSRPEHRMRLDSEFFAQMEAGQKTLELRLNDEKRRRIRVGDVLAFEDRGDETEVLKAEVTGLYPFPSFAALFAALPPSECGLGDDPAQAVRVMDGIYPPEAQQKYGVLALRVRLL